MFRHVINSLIAALLVSLFLDDYTPYNKSNSAEIGERYGARIRSRCRGQYNLIAFQPQHQINDNKHLGHGPLSFKQ